MEFSGGEHVKLAPFYYVNSCPYIVSPRKQLLRYRSTPSTYPKLEAFKPPRSAKLGKPAAQIITVALSAHNCVGSGNPLPSGPYHQGRTVKIRSHNARLSGSRTNDSVYPRTLPPLFPSVQLSARLDLMSIHVALQRECRCTPVVNLG
jgi:hypothetical protein